MLNLSADCLDSAKSMEVHSSNGLSSTCTIHLSVSKLKRTGICPNILLCKAMGADGGCRIGTSDAFPLKHDKDCFRGERRNPLVGVDGVTNQILKSGLTLDSRGRGGEHGPASPPWPSHRSHRRSDILPGSRGSR